MNPGDKGGKLSGGLTTAPEAFPPGSNKPNPYGLIHRVAFELSNRCVHAHEHTICPAHLKLQDPPRNLQAKIVAQVLNAVAKNHPSGKVVVYFHNYNEPLADPRLMVLAQMARLALPRSTIWITTSGWNLDQVLLNELAEAGVNRVKVSVYDRETLARFNSLRNPPGLRLSRKAGNPSRWQEVLRPEYIRVYDDPPTQRGRCRAPYYELTISHRGQVCLCCGDWARRVTFGDLGVWSFDQIIRSDEMLSAHAALSRGERTFDVCRRCRHGD